MKLARLRIPAAALLFTSGLGWWATRRMELPAPASAGIGVTADNSRWEALFDGKLPLAERLSQARRIDGSFPLPLLEAKTQEFGPESAGQSAEHHFAIWNEIIGQCRRRNLHPGSLSAFLMGEIQNPALPSVIRDYAVQHLAHWICPGSPGYPGEMEDKKKRQGVDLLCAIAGDTSVRILSIPGTALLALSEMEKSRAFDLKPYWPLLDASLTRLIGDAVTPPLLRQAAVQSAARARRQGHLPAIRRLIAEGSAAEPLLLAAVAALGSMGEAGDRELLNSIVVSGSMASHAAAASLARLDP